MKADNPILTDTPNSKPATVPLHNHKLRPAVGSRSNVSQAFNALANAWETSRRKHQPSRYHKPVGFREGCALADFGRSVGSEARAAIEFAVANWSTFVSAAENTYGLFGPQPREPHVKFFVKYHDCAVNLLLQSIAKTKQHESNEAKSQMQGTQMDAHQKFDTSVERRPTNMITTGNRTLLKPPETAPISLFWTHEQAAFMCDFSKDHDAFFDRITARYGACIMRGLASKELLAGEVVMDSCNGNVVRAVLCDIPVTPDSTTSGGTQI